MVVEFRLDLREDPTGDNNDATHRPLLTAHYQSEPGASREAVFIDLQFFLLISAGFEAIWARGLGSLWAPVAACGRFVLPLLECCNQKAALCSIGRLQSAGWEIARYCSNG